MSQQPEAPKSAEWQAGYETAEKRFYANEAEPDWTNPFANGSESWWGFEEGVYVLTQK